MTKYFLFGLIIQIAFQFSAISNASSINDFVDQFKATCEGEGPNKVSGHWDWTIATTHAGDEGVVDAASLSVYESSPHSDHIWLVTFMKPNQPATETVEDEVNVTNFSSELKDQTLKGSIDSYAYAFPNRPLPPVFEAHWSAILQLGAKSGVFSLKYKGYNPTQDPDYSFSCNLERE
jgi:hypothetical protein